jgi:hypothetical protein
MSAEATAVRAQNKKTAHLNAIGGSGFPTRKAKTKTDHNTQSHHGAAHEYTDDNATHKDECVCGSRGRWMGQDTKPNRIVGGLGETSNEVRTIHATTKHGARGIGKQQLPKKDNGETMKKTKTRRYKTWLQQQWRHRVPLQSEGQQLHHYVPKKPHTLQAYSADSPTKTHTSLRLES